MTEFRSGIEESYKVEDFDEALWNVARVRSSHATTLSRKTSGLAAQPGSP